jgi:hypothetical protein
VNMRLGKRILFVVIESNIERLADSAIDLRDNNSTTLVKTSHIIYITQETVESACGS